MLQGQPALADFYSSISPSLNRHEGSHSDSDFKPFVTVVYVRKIPPTQPSRT